MSEVFVYEKSVVFHETDAMKVAHHSNYLRFFEEARSAFLIDRNLSQYHMPHSDLVLAVIEARCRYLLPAYLGDALTVQLQARCQRLKVRFQYAIYSDRYEDRAIALGTSTHAPLDEKLNVCRLPEVMKSQLEKESWTETWPLNL